MTTPPPDVVTYDLVIRHGRVIDPSQGIDDKRTICVQDGRIARVSGAPEAVRGRREIDATDRIVVPGLVDLHTHCYWGGTPLGVNADKIGPATGVTTWVDTGSSGAGNFEGFFHHVIERSAVRIVPFLHVSHIGLTASMGLLLPIGELFDFRLMNFHELVRVGEAFADSIAGVKVRASINATGPNSMDALRVARQAADALESRLMVHVGPPPPFIDDVLVFVREGDIVTHCFTPYDGGIVDRNLVVKDCVRAARDRGVLFDVGHGSGSFAFEVAEAALEQGFAPDAISSDLHAKCVAGPVFDLPTTMAKFLALGMGLPEVIARVTHLPAEAIGHHDLGTLREGAPADIAVFELVYGETRLVDARGTTRLGTTSLVANATIRDGRVLNPTVDTRQEGTQTGPFPRPRARRDGA